MNMIQLASKTPVNIVIACKPGYQHAAALLEPARFVTHKFREAGWKTKTSVNSFEQQAINIVFGAHEFVELIRDQSTSIVLFNLEQLSRAKRDFSVDHDYLRLLRTNAVIDYDTKNTFFYRTDDNDLKSRPVPIINFSHASYLRTKYVPLEERPLDLLFFGSVNSYRNDLLGKIADAGVNVKIITAADPVYGEPLNDLIRNSRAVLNIPFYGDTTFEQARAFQVLSCGTPLVSLRPATVPLNFEPCVTWLNQSEISEFFRSRFATELWISEANAQLKSWLSTSAPLSALTIAALHECLRTSLPPKNSGER